MRGRSRFKEEKHCIFCGDQGSCINCNKEAKAAAKIISPIIADFIWERLTAPSFLRQMLVIKPITRW